MNAIASIDPATEEENRIARHLRQCQELAELGMALARAAAQKAALELAATSTDSAPGRKTPSAALAFARLTRLVQQTITLEARLAGGPALARRTNRYPKPIAPRPQPDDSPGQNQAADPGQIARLREGLAAITADAGMEVDPATHPDQWLGLPTQTLSPPPGPTQGIDYTAEDFLSYLRTRFPNPRDDTTPKPST